MSDPLFWEGDYHATIEGVKEALRREISGLEANRVLGTPNPDLTPYLVEKYSLDVPRLHRDNEYVEQLETKVLLTDSFTYHLPRGPVQVDGTAYRVTIPFTGDRSFFRIRPSSFDTMPPRAEVDGTNVYVTVSGRDPNPAQVKRELDQLIGSIEKYLGWHRGSADQFNASLPALIEQDLTSRRDKLLKDRETVSALGFKVRERGGAPQTFVAPEVRRKVAPTLPPAPKEAFKPEPTLSEEDYQHILGVIDQMARVMELSPNAFETLNEEALRTHFLVQLNGHYKGQATGETFNYQGKTDILIKSETSKNPRLRRGIDASGSAAAIWMI